MRMLRRLVIVAVALVVASSSQVGAVNVAQRCEEPIASSQSGRAVLTPGVNKASLVQHIGVKVSLFHCLPANTTRGSGALTATITTGAQTCRLFTASTVLKTSAKITWKNSRTSTLAAVFSLAGSSHLVNVKAKVTSGVFLGHSAVGQFRYTLVVSPSSSFGHTNGVAQACANKVRPNKFGRIAIKVIDVHTTKPFVLS